MTSETGSTHEEGEGADSRASLNEIRETQEESRQVKSEIDNWFATSGIDKPEGFLPALGKAIEKQIPQGGSSFEIAFRVLADPELPPEIQSVRRKLTFDQTNELGELVKKLVACRLHIGKGAESAE